ncbi:nitrate/nitrite transport system permease protein [Plasticicumulans lactativorans]|uniref:Nitrate/nitrite transport system permease protein n=1 Tax=Plasticicumulans lactativorans TaxID=1133106 RepID=A0A4V2SCE4_9GAMM|nr:nitrate ABC transporter permease [Plasticicumulans lactativorans]TCO78930.1 nitrate/nitrite transport system permease protein [Plasticicumulans lactativorans]
MNVVLPMKPAPEQPPAADAVLIEPKNADAATAALAAAPRPPVAAAAPARPDLLAPLGAFLNAVMPALLGLALLLTLWAAVAQMNPQLPGPLKTWEAAVEVFADPFYRNGPNDQGIGWNVLSSLQRVGIGFGLAALVGIPAGFILGRFRFANAMLQPVIALLRPVSPLAWLPIGLLVFKKADPAATWTIFICSIWPMILNTAQGVQRVPQDYLNVARVLNLSEFKIVTRILFPAVLPYMLTGIRLSIGTAWLVIVAAEMLTGGVGIGFWVWDEWNNLKVESIVIAIFVIGVVGLLLENALLLLARRFQYDAK